jgi:hypothetical protein
LDDLWIVETLHKAVANGRRVIEDVLELLRIDKLQRQVTRVAKGVLQNRPLLFCLWSYRTQTEKCRTLDMSGEDAMAVALCLVVVGLKEVLPAIEVNERQLERLGGIIGATDSGPQEKLVDVALSN